MNIFYLHLDPVACARMHNDKHCVKMIVEYAQLLSTTHRILDGDQYLTTNVNGRKVVRWKLSDYREDVLYQAAHVKHPSAIWTRQCDKNYSWLYTLFCNLIDEYSYRYGRTHKTSELIEYLKFLPGNIKIGQFTEPTPAMPDEYKVEGDSLRSYHNYYRYGKDHLAKWSKRPTPILLDK
jgi:hypothetical protein